jgi:hypothetical protein
MHVWACDSPENRLVANRAWASAQRVSLEHGITLFKYSESDSSDQVCLDILETVDLHHGEYSHAPPWSEVEVYGAQLTPTLESALVELGFSKFHQTTDGFVAVREGGRSG